MYYTVQQVAERYSVSVHTVLGWIHRGELRAVNVARHLNGKRPQWRIAEDALAQWEQIRTTQPAPPKTRRRKSDDGVIEFY